MEEQNINNEFSNRREYRRKRRVRNQIIVYITSVVILAGILTGLFFGIKYLANIIKNGQSADQKVTEEQLPEGEEEITGTVEAPEEYVEDTGEEAEGGPLDDMINDHIAQMPLEDKVAGLFFITPEALTDTGQVIRAGDATREKLEEYTIGGLIYSSDNIQSGDQLKEMLQNTLEMSQYPVFLGIDEEGGRIARVADKDLGEKVDPMGVIGQGADNSRAYEAGQTIGAYLTEFGFNTNFAPVADVLADPEDQILGDRSFGGDAEMVAGMVSSAVSGLSDAGVYTCLKHFPGLGSTVTDTHEGMAISELTLDEMRSKELLPFQAGIEAGAEFVMVGHLSLPNIVGENDNTPASLSSVIITDILRGELGYEGIIITDALNMGAVTEYYTSDVASVMAIQAGADMILMPENFKEAYDGVLLAVQDGTLTEERIDESLRRIYRIKFADAIAE